MGEAEASSAVLCVEGAPNSLSKGGGEGDEGVGRKKGVREGQGRQGGEAMRGGREGRGEEVFGAEGGGGV